MSIKWPASLLLIHRGFSHKTGKNKYGEADDFDVIDADYYNKDD